MSEETGPQADGETASVITPAADTGNDLSVSQAARTLSQARRPKQSTDVSADAATAEPELSARDNAAPENQATGETQEDAPAEKPPRELPRSWTKDRTEHWNRLDPDTQEFLLEQDRKASFEVRRVQNEAAEIRKAVEAERAQAERLRQHYEAQLPVLMQTLDDARNASFADIRTADDITKLANEDPFRYLQWQAHQTKMQAVNAELERAKGRQNQQRQSDWAQHRQREDALAAELIPELADKAKGPALLKRAADRLTELGFKPEELNRLASGEDRISIFDHRLQQLIYSDLKLAEIQSAKAAVIQKPVPPVQRPGAARPAGNSERLAVLTNQLNTSGSLKDAAALLAARRSQQRRA